jgi:hypothetical protein
MNKAIISKCEKYRYQLHRTWDEDLKKVLFIMLNPSTADAIHNDLTTTRCINYAKKWGYGGLMIGNIYPYRAKRPKKLKMWLNKHNVEVYDARFENTIHVQRMAQEASKIVCAWGGNHPGIPKWVANLGYITYLELCDDGITPKHPLGNLSKDLVPKHYKLNTMLNR